MLLLNYFAFVLLALLGDWRSVDVGGGRSVQRHGNANTRDADQNHRHQVDDDEQQQEEAAAKMTQVIEAVGADLARRNAVPTVDCEGVAVTIQVRRCENERNKPRNCDQFPRPRLAVDHHRTERMNDGIVSATQTNLEVLYKSI